MIIEAVLIEWKYNDGGRKDAGYRGDTGDCVTRAIAIATGTSYQKVYDDLNELAANTRGKKARRSKSRTGVNRVIYEKYLRGLGWEFVPTMKIGSGCKIHLKKNELPDGVIIARVSKHLCAVIDGVIHDTHDPSRDGTRCVYGYYRRAECQEKTQLQA